MAILKLNFIKIHESVINNFDLSQRKKVAFLGYPDLLVPKEILIQCLGEENLKKLNHDSKMTDIQLHHGYPSTFEIFSLLEIFDKIYNFETTVFDISNVRGIETNLDLNEPLPENYKNQFDAVIDASVQEHCFNIAMAFKNMCELVKLNGIASTVTPIYMFNHGYYNVNPIMPRDGFVHNGFSIIDKTVMSIAGDETFGFNKKSIPIRQFNLLTAKKIKEIDFKYPIQTSKK